MTSIHPDGLQVSLRPVSVLTRTWMWAGSRSDAYFGNALVFNQSVFDQTKSYWTGKNITIKMAAKARLARIKTSQATNPTYSLSDLATSASLGESVVYIVVLGDKKSATVKRSWAEWFFGTHRFLFLSRGPYVLFPAWIIGGTAYLSVAQS